MRADRLVQAAVRALQHQVVERGSAPARSREDVVHMEGRALPDLEESAIAAPIGVATLHLAA